MSYTNLHFLGSNAPGGLIASHLSKMFSGSTFHSVEVNFSENDVVVFIDPVGVLNERNLWEMLGHPKCILHVCNSGEGYDAHAAYERVNIDIHTESIGAVIGFLRENGLFLDETRPIS